MNTAIKRARARMLGATSHLIITKQQMHGIPPKQLLFAQQRLKAGSPGNKRKKKHK